MSIVNSNPEYWATGLKRNLYAENVWRMYPDDRSSTVMRTPGGDRFHVNLYSDNTVTVRDYTRYRGTTTGTERTVPRGDQPATSVADFPLDQYKEVIMEFDDLDHIQGNQELFDRHVREGARKLDRGLNNYLRTQNSGTGADGNALPAAQKTSINGYKDAASVTKFRDAVYSWLTDMSLQFDRAELPMMDRVVMGSPEFCKAAVDYLVVDKPNLGAGSIVDAAYRDFAVVKIAGSCGVVWIGGIGQQYRALGRST